MAPNHELDCLVKRLDCSVVVKVKVTGKVKNSSPSTTEPFVTKLGMVMHYCTKFGSTSISNSEDSIWINSH